VIIFGKCLSPDRLISHSNQSQQSEETGLLDLILIDFNIGLIHQLVQVCKHDHLFENFLVLEEHRLRYLIFNQQAPDKQACGAAQTQRFALLHVFVD